MSLVSEIEVIFFTYSVKCNRTINEKDRVVYIVFLVEFREKWICGHVHSCRFKLCME